MANRNRINKLILQIQEAQRLDKEVFSSAVVMPASLMEEPKDSPNYDKWEAIVSLNNGTFGSPDTTTYKLYFDTKAEAMKAAEDLEAIHSPQGKRIKSQEPFYLVAGWGDD